MSALHNNNCKNDIVPINKMQKEKHNRNINQRNNQENKKEVMNKVEIQIPSKSCIKRTKENDIQNNKELRNNFNDIGNKSDLIGNVEKSEIDYDLNDSLEHLEFSLKNFHKNKREKSSEHKMDVTAVENYGVNDKKKIEKRNLSTSNIHRKNHSTSIIQYSTYQESERNDQHYPTDKIDKIYESRKKLMDYYRLKQNTKKSDDSEEKLKFKERNKDKSDKGNIIISYKLNR